jgi:hypothetical protein
MGHVINYHMSNEYQVPDADKPQSDRADSNVLTERAANRGRLVCGIKSMAVAAFLSGLPHISGKQAHFPGSHRSGLVWCRLFPSAVGKPGDIDSSMV